MNNMAKTIVWFRRDLRIEDNRALSEGIRDCGCILPLYIWCPKEEGQFYPGRVSRWWLKESLTHLDWSLRSLGAGLVFIKTDSTLDALMHCVNLIGATRVVFNHLYDPVSLFRDHNVKLKLLKLGISVQTYNGDLLYEPWEIYDECGHAFTTFDAYWDKCVHMQMDPVLLSPPLHLVRSTGIIENGSVDDLGLEDELEKSSNALLGRVWSPGWSNADKALFKFSDKYLLNYSKNREKVDGNKSSLLSPYLHFGELSVRKVFQCVKMKQMQWIKEGNQVGEEGASHFFRMLGLREYSRYICFNFPFTHERSLLSNLKYFPWNVEQDCFKAWKQGRTGYPLVDAGMRELWATGWIHNRVRVIVSSFCVKVLLLPWKWGMEYFWDTLLDADLENDILGWQYISGSIPDGHDLNRLDNPEVQGSKYDPEGDYVRRWLPELSKLPTEWIHHPWEAPLSVIKSAGVELGLNYPKPIIELDLARERLTQAIFSMWEMEANPNGVTEVFDNSNLPIVMVKRNAGCPDTSSRGENISTVQNSKNQSRHRKRQNRLENVNPMQTNFHCSMSDEDLCSTADSSSAKKLAKASSKDGQDMI